MITSIVISTSPLRYLINSTRYIPLFFFRLVCDCSPPHTCSLRLLAPSLSRRSPLPPSPFDRDLLFSPRPAPLNAPFTLTSLTRSICLGLIHAGMSRSNKHRGEDESLVHASVLQNANESMESRLAACDAVVALTRNESTCGSLCAAGGIHAIINALKTSQDSPTLVKGTVQALCNIYKFDSKLTSVVMRLQDGIGSLLEALREHIHSGDTELLQTLLTALSDVSSNTSNVTLFIKHNGNAVVIACILAHLKYEQLLLPALQTIVNTSRSPSHVLPLSREGAVPAILAAILAHLRCAEVLKLALMALRNIVTDEAAAARVAGQGAYRIVYAALQAHCTVEQIELVKLGSAVLWRMQHVRFPPTALLHAQLCFTHAPVMADGAESSIQEDPIVARGADGSSSSDDEGLLTPRASAANGRENAGGEGADLALAVPGAVFMLNGHLPFLDSVPSQPGAPKPKRSRAVLGALLLQCPNHSLLSACVTI